MDIWVMEQTNAGWGEPRNLGAPVNTTADEWFPTLASNGTMYFGSGRPGGHGKTDLYRARRRDGKFTEPENLGPNINTAADEVEGCIAPDESFLIFMALGRKDSRGGCARGPGSTLRGTGQITGLSPSAGCRQTNYKCEREANVHDGNP